ncbi:hypothetical protein BC332_04549 [Capsicum chinense]|nr:hypothetical protein BC332_04549 [Capsicum chinense]
MTKKKLPIHARDSLSGDSLSFSGLVCIQDVSVVQAQSNIPSSTRAKKETEFEFGHFVTQNINQNSNSSPADVFFYKGQILPQAIQYPQPNDQADQVVKQSHKSEKDFPIVRNNSKSGTKATAGQSFGQKILRFTTPCRDCRGTETIPSIRPQALR